MVAGGRRRAYTPRMKYAIVIPDGCADEPQAIARRQDAVAGGPQAEHGPHRPDRRRRPLEQRARPLTPASDVATLSLFGYDPLAVYTGRAPLETAAMGIPLGPNDWAIRCNLVTVENGEMRDFTAGHITSEEGRPLIEAVHAALGGPVAGGRLEFHPGVSYRNILVFRADKAAPFTAGDEDAAAARHSRSAHRRPSAQGAGERTAARSDGAQPGRSAPSIRSTGRASRSGKRPATQIWLWGQGKAPTLRPFAEVYGKRGAIISAVDLVRGVGVLLGWKRIDVPGATGYLDTDYAAKGRYAVAALTDHDLVCVHVEAPDEASHEGRADAKVKALERDRPAHRRPAAGSAAAGTATGAFWCRRTTARRCGPAPTPTARCRSPWPGPGSRRRASRPTTRPSRRKAIWCSRRATN